MASDSKSSSPKQQKTMAGKPSLAAELVQAINMPSLTSVPAYISESDATSVEEFLQCKLAKDLVVDTSKIMWGGEVNNNHVFEMYNDFSATKDSVKLRMEMLVFVSENNTRYSNYCFPLLKMMGLDLVSWMSSMSYFGNSADTLCLYALSDMLGVHTCVITGNRPWTTVNPNFGGNLEDVLNLCHVNLLYLGEKKFARLWKKTSPDQPSHVGMNFNYPPWLMQPSARNELELETAETLINLGSSLQHPPILDCPPTTTYDDAMDKIVEKLDTNQNCALNRIDAMDQIVSVVPEKNLDVETPPVDISVLDDIPDAQPRLDVEVLDQIVTPPTVKIKSCVIKLKRLETILQEEERTEVPTLKEGEHFTRSKSKPTPTRTTRRPRTASSGKTYSESLLSDDDKPKQRPASTPAAVGPSTSRMTAQNRKSKYPDTRLPPIKKSLSDCEEPENEVEEYPVPEIKPVSTKQTTGKTTSQTKGVVKVTEYTLKKPTVERVYKCRMCKFKASSAKELHDHHQSKHGIMYCDHCERPFNNQLSLSRHLYEHTLERKFVCSSCKEAFPFKSQLTYHKRKHIKRRAFFCSYPGCDKKFKNSGDLNRHARSHTKKGYQCPDCDYWNADKRNYDSHRICHSNIERYFCPNCGQGFKFNTQKQRHVKAKECTVKRSESPEF